MNKKNVIAVIPARGGSKGIPKKNIVNFCGKPLLAWSIEQALNAVGISSVWVSSDDDEILSLAEKYGAKPIPRPGDLSGDFAASESAWMHAADFVQSQGVLADVVVGMQATSPLREAKDLDLALRVFEENKLDSLFSASQLEDFFIWRQTKNGSLESLNYDYLNRKRRQDLGECQVVENGSFYIFTPEGLRSTNNRLHGRIGYSDMEFWKSFEINNAVDLKLCAAIMESFLL